MIVLFGLLAEKIDLSGSNVPSGEVVYVHMLLTLIVNDELPLVYVAIQATPLNEKYSPTEYCAACPVGPVTERLDRVASIISFSWNLYKLISLFVLL